MSGYYLHLFVIAAPLCLCVDAYFVFATYQQRVKRVLSSPLHTLLLSSNGGISRVEIKRKRNEIQKEEKKEDEKSHGNNRDFIFLFRFEISFSYIFFTDAADRARHRLDGFGRRSAVGGELQACEQLSSVTFKHQTSGKQRRSVTIGDGVIYIGPRAPPK